LFLVLASLCQTVEAQESPRILVLPSKVILGDPFSVRLVDLPAGAQVTLQAEAAVSGGVYRSKATFRVPDNGEIDLARQEALSGTYTGVDSLGMFWSMREVQGGVPARTESDSSVVEFTLSRGERVLARSRLERLFASPGVTATEVREGGLAATFCRDAAPGRRPGVILVGGSGGGIGWQRMMAKLLASHGYSALGLAYFDFEGLPSALEEIPLEYFGRAIRWMQESPFVDPERLAVCGVSKGGELALLLGASFPAIKAVVAYVPGSAVFQSIAPSWPMTSSWSRDGKGLPFVPYDLATASSGADLLEIYQASLKNVKAVEEARIPVENIAGPVLLISARDDTIWPSTAMSEAVVVRLNAADHPHGVDHVAYENAGHSISRPVHTALVGNLRNGGTAAGNAHASVDAWRQLLGFLAEHLKP
jgi:dienelactone hydrolase